MKFSTKLISLFVNATLALAAINDKAQHDDTFNFWVTGSTGGTATIVSLRKNPTTAKSITFPAYVYVEGYKFKVTGVLDHSFSGTNCPFEDVYVSSLVESFEFDSFSFNDCKNLKRVVLYNDNVTAELTAFRNSNKNMSFLSKGTKSFIKSYSDKLVRDLSIPVKNYRSVNSSTKRKDLLSIATKINKYFTYSNIRDSGDLAVNLVTKYGTYDGFARLLRQLAVSAGFPESDIQIGGDNNGHYWNYVKLGSYWYNLDVNYLTNNANTFIVGKNTFKNRLRQKYGVTLDPSRYIIWYTVYGYADEFRGQQTYENWDTYLRQRGGKRAN